MKRFHKWMHRHGWARILTSESTSGTLICQANVAVRGPAFAAERLARFSLAGCDRLGVCAPVDWNTVRVERVSKEGTFRRSVWLRYHRLPARRVLP